MPAKKTIWAHTFVVCNFVYACAAELTWIRSTVISLCHCNLNITRLAFEAAPASIVEVLRLCTTSADRAAKFYDVATFDMINMFRLDFTPTASCWVHKARSPRPVIAIADAEEPVVRVYHAEGVAEPVRVVALHAAPVLVMAHCAAAPSYAAAQRGGPGGAGGGGGAEGAI